MAAGDDREQLRVRAVKRLTRASAVTRILGVMVMIGAVIAMLASCTANRSDERLAIFAMAFCALVIGSLVWSTGAFHGAVATALPGLMSLDRKIEWLGALISPETEPTPEQTVDQPPLAVVEEPIALPPPPEPEKVPCPLCGGLIHPDATRCVHCMRKIARAS